MKPVSTQPQGRTGTPTDWSFQLYGARPRLWPAPGTQRAAACLPLDVALMTHTSTQEHLISRRSSIFLAIIAFVFSHYAICSRLHFFCVHKKESVPNVFGYYESRLIEVSVVGRLKNLLATWSFSSDRKRAKYERSGIYFWSYSHCCYCKEKKLHAFPIVSRSPRVLSQATW